MPRKPPVTLTVHILPLAARHAHPYKANAQPKHTFPLRLDPNTTITEACTFAGEYLRTRPSTFVDTARFEARDGEGFLFGGQEAVGHELGEGGAMYLIEDAIDAEEVRRRREMLRDAEKKAPQARTPRGAKKVKTPRVTPSQRVLAMVQESARAARSEPRTTPSRAEVVARAAKSEVKGKVQRRDRPMRSLELQDREASTVRGEASPEQVHEADTSEESSEDLPLAITATRRKAALVSSTKDESQNSSELFEIADPTIRAATTRASGGQRAKVVYKSRAWVESSEDSAPITPSINRHNSPDHPSERAETTAVLTESIADLSLIESSSQVHASVTQPADKVDASTPAVASQRQQASPTLAASLAPQHNSERVIPSSQEPSPSQLIDEQDQSDAMATHWTSINASKLPPVRPRSASPSEAALRSLVDAHIAKEERAEPRKSKPDPYDISAVLSDEEKGPPRTDLGSISASIRKLGGAKKHPASVSISVPRNSLLISKQPVKTESRIPPTAASAARAQDQATIPSTPLARAPLHGPLAGLSFAPGPLLSSPTNHVAAALAKGRAKARRQPYPEVIVIDESSDEVYEDVLVDARDHSSAPRAGSRSLEASLPWSAPPLRVEDSPLRLRKEDPFWTLRTTGRRTLRAQSEMEAEEMNAKDNMRTPRQLEEKRPTANIGSGRLKAEILPENVVSSFILGSPVKELTEPVLPAATTFNTPVKPPLWVPSGKSPLLLVHGSSSSEEGVEEIGFVNNMRPINSQASSPSKIIETVVIDESSSPVGGEGGCELELISGAPVNDSRSQPDRDGGGQEDHIEGALLNDHQPDLGYGGAGSPEGTQVHLPIMDELPPLRPALYEDDIQSQQEAIRLIRVPETDPKSDNIDMDTPPSGQPPKRKRKLSDDLNSEEERRVQKKAKREARDAKKAEKKRRRKEKRAQEEEQHRQHQAWLQEERKRLALEKARRRALELELVVSSPAKAAEMGLGFSDKDDEEQSEIGSSPPVRSVETRLFEAVDENDPLPSRETEERPSWRELSKRHFSASPSSSQEHAASDQDAISVGEEAVEAAGSLSVGDVESAPEQAELTQKGGVAGPVEAPQFQVLNNWAFLEATVGTDAYSPFEIHNRIHLQMINASLYDSTSHARLHKEASGPKTVMQTGHEDSELVGSEIGYDVAVKSETPTSRSAPEDATAGQAFAADEVEMSRHTVRSPAPSPKYLAAVPAQALEATTGNTQQKSFRSKSHTRKKKEASRKKRRKRKGKQGLFQQLRQNFQHPAPGE